MLIAVLLIAVSNVGLAQNNNAYICPKSNACDTFFGDVVQDPYRWMEEPGTTDVEDWLKHQRRIMRGVKGEFNSKVLSAYNAITSTRGSYHFPLYTSIGKYLFKSFYSGSPYDIAPVLYYYDESKDGTMQVAYNPNKLPGKEIKQIVDVSMDSASKYMAVIISRSGSDWKEIRVRNFRNGEDLPDVIKWVKFSKIVWWGNGFYYARFDSVDALHSKTASNGNQRMYYHRLGTSQDNDEEVMRVPEYATVAFSFYALSPTPYMVIHSVTKIRNATYQTVSLMDMSKGLQAEQKAFIISPTTHECKYRVVGFADSSLLVHTDFGAPTGRLLAFNKDSLNISREVIPQYKEVLRSVSIVNHSLVALYQEEGRYKAAITDYNGYISNIMYFDTGVCVSSFSGNEDDTVSVFTEFSYFAPPIACKINLKERYRDVIEKTQVHYNPGLYKTDLVNYTSKDGTVVPMYLTYKKGIQLKGDNPVVLYGYGGFGIVNSPAYDYSNILFFDNGGILAVPLIRGGGEKGLDWHKAGRRVNKQNSIDDFIAAADFLVSEGYTTRNHLAIKGGSNGGLLVAATMIQRPDLCKVVIAQMGVYDMLRYHKFTVGKYMMNEYGDVTDETNYRALRAYSPLHNLEDNVEYPAMLLLTGENDDRVPPLHTYKFLATLQEKSSGANPHIMYFEEDAGHQGAIGYDAAKYTKAFVMAFMFEQFGLKMKFPL